MKVKKNQPFMFVISVLFFTLLLSVLPVNVRGDDNAFDDDWFNEDLFGTEEVINVADPLEPLNRLSFYFNDRLYFWVLKPVAAGYSMVLAEDIRICIRDFFSNLLSPVRIVNSLLQGKIKESGVETARFVVNSTFGVGGLADPAATVFGLTNVNREDFGQTLGRYGLGGGIHLHWPILGPSNIRDTIGLFGDFLVNPLSHLATYSTVTGIGIYSVERVNHISLHMGDYERFKKLAFDPYLAMRDAYSQHRNSKIKDTMGQFDELY